LDLDLLRWVLGFRAACKETQMRRTIDVTLALRRAGKQLSAELTAEDKLPLYWMPGVCAKWIPTYSHRWIWSPFGWGGLDGCKKGLAVHGSGFRG